jgi:hypothetical protein
MEQDLRVIEDGSRVDVLFLYSTSAKNYWGGAAQVEAGALQMEDFLNEAFTNSLPTAVPPLRARFVGIEELTGSVPTTLEGMAANTRIRERRRVLKADLVILLRASSGGYAGQAWVYCGSPEFSKTHAFGYVRADYLFRIKTTAHEIGHLFGANHDPGNTGVNSCWHSDSRGHFFNATNPQGVTRCYGTIMSYICADRRIPYFSNPSILFLGRPTGIAGARNNARAILGSRVNVANYFVSDDTSTPQGPVVTFLRPENNANLPTNSTIEIVATITDENGVSTAELYWQKTDRFLPCPGTNNDDWRCTLEGGQYKWQLDVGAAGPRAYLIRAVDSQGNRTVTPTRNVNITATGR